jgi:hypothetical protein
LHCTLAVSSCYGKDLGIITKGGDLAIHYRGEAHIFVCFPGMMEESGANNAQKRLLQPMTCLGITAPKKLSVV